MSELPNKTYTKFGSPVESNLSKLEHDVVHKTLEMMEEMALKQSGGADTLLDMIRRKEAELQTDQSVSEERKP